MKKVLLIAVIVLTISEIQGYKQPPFFDWIFGKYIFTHFDFEVKLMKSTKTEKEGVFKDEFIGWGIITETLPYSNSLLTTKVTANKIIQMASTIDNNKTLIRFLYYRKWMYKIQIRDIMGSQWHPEIYRINFTDHLRPNWRFSTATLTTINYQPRFGYINLPYFWPIGKLFGIKTTLPLRYIGNNIIITKSVKQVEADNSFALTSKLNVIGVRIGVNKFYKVFNNMAFNGPNLFVIPIKPGILISDQSDVKKDDSESSVETYSTEEKKPLLGGYASDVKNDVNGNAGVAVEKDDSESSLDHNSPEETVKYPYGI